MAKNTGLIKFTGKLGGLSGRDTAFGNIIQTPGGFKGDRIKTEARYEKTRQLNSEFGRCAKLASIFKQQLDFYLGLLPDPYVYNHIQKWLTAIKECDIDSAKGDKTVAKGLLTDSGARLFRNFSFNRSRSSGARAFADYSVDTASGSARLKVDSKFVDFKKAADVVGLQLVLMRIDPDGTNCALTTSAMVEVERFCAVTEFLLEAPVPVGSGILAAVFFSGSAERTGDELVFRKDVGNTLATLEFGF